MKANLHQLTKQLLTKKDSLVHEDPTNARRQQSSSKKKSHPCQANTEPHRYGGLAIQHKRVKIYMQYC